METNKTIIKINETESWFFEKIKRGPKSIKSEVKKK